MFGKTNRETCLNFGMSEGKVKKKKIQPSMPRPYREVFYDSPEIMKSRNRDLKTTHVTFRGYCVHFLCFFFRPISKQL